MADHDDERVLEGGQTTADVVRVGSTVRRPLGPNAEFVHELLRHLESAGFAGAPRLLGIDDRGREVLTFIDGWVPPNLEHCAWSEGQLTAAARLLRRLHDVTEGSPLAGTEEVVRHGDPSPVNFVWRDGSPVALIDWDAAQPGRRIHDVAYLAWMFVLGGSGDATGYAGVAGQARRLRVVCDAYGLTARHDLMDAIDQEQRRVAAGIADDAGKRTPARVAEVVAWVSSENAWLHANRTQLATHL